MDQELKGTNAFLWLVLSSENYFAYQRKPFSHKMYSGLKGLCIRSITPKCSEFQALLFTQNTDVLVLKAWLSQDIFELEYSATQDWEALPFPGLDYLLTSNLDHHLSQERVDGIYPQGIYTC